MANTLRIKRRISGGPGAPSSLKNAEVAFNEVDKILYYGWGSDLENDATNVIAIGGEGEFVTRSSTQSITGLKTFASNTAIQDTLTTTNFVIEGGSVDVTTSQFDIALDATLINLGSASSNVHIAGDLNIDGDHNLTGTLDIGEDLILAGDLAVNGGDITTTASSFNLLNTNATTVNAFGAANTINIGSSIGTTTINNSLNVLGNLYIEGELTTINSTTISVDDKNLELGSTDTPTDDTASGGGITLRGATDKTIIWDKINSDWTSSENWNIASGKEYKIGATSVLSSTTLGSSVLNSSLTTLGTITAGVWHGTEIAANYGGIGQTTYAKGDIIFAGSANPTSLSKLTIGSYDATNEVGQILQVNSDGTVSWSWNIDGGTF